MMYPNEHEHDPFKTLFVAIIFLFLMYFALYHLYDCLCLPRSSSHHHFRNHRPAMVFLPSNPSHTASRGLDPAVLKSLPVFTFSDVTHKDPIDCPVCLSEFEEGESGRVLPGCKHTFHVECIDMWFHSHSTCPLCRSTVTMVEEQIVIAISPEPVSATEPGSSAMPLDDLGRERVAIETTRRSLSEFEEGLRRLPVNHSSTSSMSRMLSLTRMLSRNRRSAPSSFAGAPSQSTSSSCQIVIIESDIERGGGGEIKIDSRHVDVP